MTIGSLSFRISCYSVAFGGNILTDRIENLHVLSFVIKTLLFRLNQSCGGSQPKLEFFSKYKTDIWSFFFFGFWEEAQIDNFLRDAPYKGNVVISFKALICCFKRQQVVERWVLSRATFKIRAQLNFEFCC